MPSKLCFRMALTIALFFSLSTSGLAQIPDFPDEKELAGKGIDDLVLRRGFYGEQPADWGVLFVPENRRAEGARPIRLHCIRQIAESKINGDEAIFTLVGGPGNSNVFGSGSLSPELRNQYDIVRVGYRGIDSNTQLTCPEFTEALQTDHPLSPESIERIRKAIRSGFDRLGNEGIDLNGYNLFEVVQDMELLRQKLGYKRIHLYGISWGTQIAYSYAMQYPDNVGKMVLVGAGGRLRGFDLWNPEMVDAQLEQFNELWKRDSEAVARSPDLIDTIRKVLTTLPGEWKGERIDRDKVRLVMWYMLRETKEAAQVFDAFVAAENGDYSGLAVLSWFYDSDLEKELKQRFGPYHAEFFSKTASSGLDLNRDWISEMDPDGSIIGSPAAKLLWGSVSRGGWPVEPVPEEYYRDGEVDIETLVVMGNLDFSSPPEYVKRELMPNLKRGHLVILSEMGHTEVAKLQPGAFFKMVGLFFAEGKVDSSGFQYNPVNFSPDNSLTDLAKQIFGNNK